ncbi:MAG: iron-regulated protein [Sandaracinus sp.]|nr:iron-regulated protein [Myxococcales bacterium]MCB9637029.1 iron-regulated protein [Sandaracinus sp.]
MTRRLLPFLLALGFGIASCGGDDDALPASTEAALETYARIVHATYQDTAAATHAMDSALEALVATPSATTLEAAQDAWRDARVPYLQTEVFRFYDGPIDGMDGNPEGFINGWPMDEQTVDYVEGDETAGRINDPSFVIAADALLDGNGVGGEADIVTGWHPIEFLLWGQDLTAPSERLPGQRSFEDFATTDNADRRGLYLTTLGDLLVGHMDELVDAWDPASTDNYRAAFLADAPEESLRKVLTGLIIFAGFESAGERMQAALDAGDQEEEHSCFSDNTHVDAIEDVRGVRNVWMGRYVRTDGSVVEGTGLRAVVEELDATLAAEITASIDAALASAESIPVPFDLAIMPGNTEGNAAVQATIDALRQTEMRLTQVFVELGFTVPAPE